MSAAFCAIDWQKVATFLGARIVLRDFKSVTLVRKPLLGPDRMWLVSENAGELNVTEIRETLVGSTPYEGVGPCTLAHRLRDVMRGEDVDYSTDFDALVEGQS